MSIQLAKRLLTVSEYHKMAEVGILDEDDRVELINGEIIEMSPIGKLHVNRVNRITSIFKKLPDEKAILSIQNPISIAPYSEPEPDISLLEFKADFYEEELPKAENVLLVIEVADTSLGYDREIKKPLFANAGIPELWIVNIEDEQVEVYKNPLNGDYVSRQIFKRGQTIHLDNLNFSVEVERILGLA
jgi:Uma2 family endonuclease